MLGISRRPRVVGQVDRVDDKQIAGWAGDRRNREPVTVQLVLDGTVINSTTACQRSKASAINGGQCGWRFGMREIWKLIAADQRLEVMVDGAPLATASGERHIPIRGREPKPGRTLLDMLADGRVIDKFGRAIRPLDERHDWQRRVDSEFPILRSQLEDTFGYAPFITYGLLLGYARSRSLISSDHDCDLTYLSAQEDPLSVRDEFQEVVEYLAANNENWTVHPYKIVLHTRFSLSPSWIGREGLRMSFGYVSNSMRVSHDEVIPLQTVSLGSMSLLAPKSPERVAEFLYGPGWRWPDTGWVWRTKWKNRPEQLAARLDQSVVDQLNSARSG